MTNLFKTQHLRGTAVAGFFALAALTGCGSGGSGGSNGGNNPPAPPAPTGYVLKNSYVTTAPTLAQNIHGAAPAQQSAHSLQATSANTATVLPLGVAGFGQLPQQLNGLYFVRGMTGDTGTMTIGVSADGVNYSAAQGIAPEATSSMNLTTDDFNMVYWGGKYVTYTISDNATFVPYYSADGYTWQRGTAINVPNANLNTCTSLTSANGVLIASCQTGISISAPVFYSYDGVTWQQQKLSTAPATLGTIASVGNLFVGMSQHYQGAPVYTSVNGINWSLGASINAVNSTANGRYFTCTGVANSTTGAETAYTGVDVTSNFMSCINNVQYVAGTGTYYASYRNYDSAGVYQALVRSQDGVAWSIVNGTVNPQINSQYAAVGAYVAGRLYYRTESATFYSIDNGATWQPMLGNLISSDAVQVNGATTVVGATKLYNPNTRQWATTQAIVTQVAGGAVYANYPAHAGSLRGVTYGNGTYVAVGDAGTILASSDGMNYTAAISGTALNINSISYANGTFVALADANTMLLSTDGRVWTQVQVSGAPYAITSVSGALAGNGALYAVGYNGTVGASTNGGASWAFSSVGTSNLYSVASNGAVAVAVGAGGAAVVTSNSGATWQAVSTGVTATLYGVTYSAADGFVAVGTGGVVVQSSDGVTWQAVSVAGAGADMQTVAVAL